MDPSATTNWVDLSLAGGHVGQPNFIFSEWQNWAFVLACHVGTIEMN